MKSLGSLAAFFFSSMLLAAEPGSAAPGVQVEVSPADGGKAVVCNLLGFKNGMLRLRDDQGKIEEVKQTEIKTIRFLNSPPPPRLMTAPAIQRDREALPPPPPDGEPSEHRRRPEGLDKRGPGRDLLPTPEFKRLRQLSENDRTGKLTEIEINELFSLRERLPLMPPFPTEGAGGKFGRVKFAEEQAENESAKNRMPRFFDLLRRKLVKAKDENEARDALLMLSMAYRQQKLGLQGSAEQLRKDMRTIENESTRERIILMFPEGLPSEQRRRDGEK